MNHTWVIPTATEGCSSNDTVSDAVDGIFNPLAVNTSNVSGYMDDCSALSQFRCAMGDLGRKLGTLELVPVTNSHRKLYSFYDENLHLLGPFTGERAWCHSLLVRTGIIQVLYSYGGEK